MYTYIRIEFSSCTFDQPLLIQNPFEKIVVAPLFDQSKQIQFDLDKIVKRDTTKQRCGEFFITFTVEKVDENFVATNEIIETDQTSFTIK